MNYPAEVAMEEIPLPTDKLSKSSSSPTTKNHKNHVVLVAVGCFNPPTNMHLRMFELAKDSLNRDGFSVIGAYISPVNDAYNKPGLQSAHHRISLCNLATKTSDFIMVDAWEASQATFQHTVVVLSRIKRCLSGKGDSSVKVMLVCGSDLLKSFGVSGVWIGEQVRCICEEYGVVCIRRDGDDVDEIIENDAILSKYKKSIRIVDDPVPNNISSSRIRDCVSKGMSVKYLLPEDVLTYVARHKLYSN